MQTPPALHERVADRLLDDACPHTTSPVTGLVRLPDRVVVPGRVTSGRACVAVRLPPSREVRRERPDAG